MRRFILLIFFSILAFGISAQTVKEEIFENIHLSAANHYAYPDPDFKKTPPPSGYKPFYLSHYARHGSRYRVNPNDYKYKTQNKLSVNYKTFCTDFTSINIKQNVNLEYKNKYFYICN